jgi:hypothetical protein
MSGDPGPRDLSDPQTLNRYSYVRNNPANMTDPMGLDPNPNIPPVITNITVTASAPSSQYSDEDLSGFMGLVGANLWQDYWLHQTYMQRLIWPPPATKPGPKPAPPPAQAQAPTGNVFTCAADFGDKYSIAGGLHALGIGTSGIGGFITNALGGNAFSGAIHLIASLGSGSSGGHSVFYHMAQGVVAGPGQGVIPPGVGGPWGASASGLATEAVAGTAWSSITGAGQTLVSLGGEASLASTAITAAEFASGVAEAKYAYDFASYLTGLGACSVGWAH